MQIIQQPKIKNSPVIHVLPATKTCLIDIGFEVDEMANAFHMRDAPEYSLKVTLQKINEFQSDIWAKLANHDLWLFGDLLERIYDQWKSQIKFGKILPNGGQIPCWIPHLQHIWS